MQTVGVGEGILDGQAHVRHAKLCLHCTVFELYHAVYDRLRMDYYFYLVRPYAEEPLGLHHFEALVHE